MSGLPYQPIPQTSYHKTPQVSQPARNPPLTSTSYQQPSDPYQDIQPATYQGDPQVPAASYIPTSGGFYKTGQQAYYHKPEQTPHLNHTGVSSSTYQKSGGTYQKVPQTARPTRQGSGLSASEVATAQNRLQSAARTQELSMMVPESVGEVQQPARNRRHRHDKSRSRKNRKNCCTIL
ncbi:uncharacterized protein EAE97_010626 [Botrytis byssoidea]|uniref:Uncharacterized protein n=1 Tax=Botrytis byssoidea TaxID=139641 RepID=A0A9P5I234_9HELO|nr:uncharacterized protein EAE97_010626 [Botrytis byssoidea]KAF7924675.1 hypothetical protein EAE97_010626 [Botrytis byssoidea]